MKRLYINCDSGVSGDMMLGAFIDMGVPTGHIEERLSRLKLDEFKLAIKKRTVAGRNVTDVDVTLDHEEDLHRHPYSGEFRNYRQIIDMINQSTLCNNVKVLSRRIFDIKARAESKVHEVPLDQVQFHEAGAVDSIVDIVGTAICYDYIGADEVVAKHVPTGYGKVRCACGILPVPAPAVQQILKDTEIPYYRSDIEQEVLTPTGASILAGVADEFGWESIEGDVLKRGYGSGKRDTGLPPLELILCEEKNNV